MTQQAPFKLDPKTVCPSCKVSPLRVPLVFNATNVDGQYICQSCDQAETLARIAAISNR